MNWKNGCFIGICVAVVTFVVVFFYELNYGSYMPNSPIEWYFFRAVIYAIPISLVAGFIGLVVTELLLWRMEKKRGVIENEKTEMVEEDS